MATGKRRSSWHFGASVLGGSADKTGAAQLNGHGIEICLVGCHPFPRHSPTGIASRCPGVSCTEASHPQAPPSISTKRAQVKVTRYRHRHRLYHRLCASTYIIPLSSTLAYSVFIGSP
jgi:hypothetical protein